MGHIIQVDPYWFHVVNVVLHTAVSLLSLSACRAALGPSFLSLQHGEMRVYHAKNLETAATMASLLFAVHPVREQVNYDRHLEDN